MGNEDAEPDVEQRVLLKRLGLSVLATNLELGQANGPPGRAPPLRKTERQTISMWGKHPDDPALKKLGRVPLPQEAIRPPPMRTRTPAGLVECGRQDYQHLAMQISSDRQPNHGPK